ncbi:hypothetical protein [Methylobacterium marchantiae]|uniref:Uncharacterized protein n=1 Tax=Methylobacterium marchantiae TaxID=600331 RepID=A0ABW3X387_9HYPH|nr:hypothetical protein AIGOOFII_0154 [Methylobacterium marchantiae]
MPVVGLCDADARLDPDPTEMAEVFEVPLARLMDLVAGGPASVSGKTDRAAIT